MPWIIGATLTVVAPLAVVYLYIGRKVSRALIDLRGWTKGKARWRVAGVILLLNAFPLVFLVSYWIMGREASKLFTGESLLLDIFLVYPFWFALTIAGQAFLVVFLPFDIVNFVAQRVSKRWKERWVKIRPKFILTVLAVTAVYVSLVIIKDTWTVRVSERTILVNHPALDGLRLALITDVQGDARTTMERLTDYVRDVNALKPDIIFFAGDLVSSGLDYIESSADVLGGLKAGTAKITVIGDHDYFSNPEQVRGALLRNGFMVLEDSTHTLEIGSARVTVTGITETYRKRVSEEEFARASQSLDGDIKILLVHQPSERVAAMAEQAGYDLFLAGHTHGGAVAIGIPGIYTIAPSNFETRYVSGFYTLGAMQIAVSNGIGMTLAPIRFQAPSEITLLTLEKPD